MEGHTVGWDGCGIGPNPGRKCLVLHLSAGQAAVGFAAKGNEPPDKGLGAIDVELLGVATMPPGSVR